MEEERVYRRHLEGQTSSLTFRSSLKLSAVAVKMGITFLQCGHPVEGTGRSEVTGMPSGSFR